MALKSLPLLFIILSIFVASVSGAALVGGWRPIKNLNDPRVQEIAKFAVTEHNKQAKAALGYVGVVKGETQVVSGAQYMLVITAKDGAAAQPKSYEAVVWDKPWEKFRKLVSFREMIQA